MPSLQETIIAGDLPFCDALLFVLLVIGAAFKPLSSGAPLLALLLGISLWGHLVLWFFYRHAVSVIFNAQVPSMRSKAFWNSYWEFYKLLRPLEARCIWV